MAGTVAFSPDTRWSAAGWLFEWTVRFMAQHVGSPDVAADLEQVVDENLGWVDVSALPEAARRAVVEALRHDLVPAAEVQLPMTIPERGRVIDHIRELTNLASRFGKPS